MVQASSVNKYPDDECDPPTFNKDMKGHEDMQTFNVYPGDRSFDVHYKSISYYKDHESSTKSKKECLDLSFKEGHIGMHNLEDPFVEVYTSTTQPTLLGDLIMCYRHKTHWSDWMDVIHG